MNPSDPAPTFGYLDFLEDPLVGVTGGYLIVSATGRPLEFHCTAPVLASRAQQILFGPTLRPHLLGEQIGSALTERSTISPSVIAISDADLAAATSANPTPLALIPRGDDAPAPASRWRRVSIDATEAWTDQTDASTVIGWLEQLVLSIDLAEPFDRIREAIREAQRLGQEGAVERDAA